MNKAERVGGLFDQFDVFSHPVTTFNFERQQKVGTSIGCIFTVFYFCVVVLYTCLKGRIFLFKT